MKATRPTLSFLLLAALPLGVAFRPASEKLDLTPRFEVGQSFTTTNGFNMEGALDELSVMANGAPALDGGAFLAEMAVTGDVVMSEEILEVRDGKIAKIRVTVDTMDVGVTGEFEAMGEGDTVDEQMEPELVGRTIEITIDEDGEETRTDVTADVEPLDDAMLEGISHENHYEMLLPKEPVEEGEEFELAPNWEDLIRDGMEGMDTSEMGADEQRAAEAMMNAFIDATTIEAIGKVTGVEDGVAIIEYTLSADMTIDDLMALIQSIAPPGEMDQVPPGIESVVEATAEFTGIGRFDMGLGQMTSLDLEGDFEVSITANMDMEGMTGSADVLMSGSMNLKGELTKN
ncbi:hypothetical protein Poly30_36650 [Planctomycetes bacterium Poly30]|uniref:Uncharacterized protein n=1 Tax=Saltatorellus ferox TaxID=2528018 RepID=A0A518EVK9_9BACT|nr:hypothetical protein Poly30_36650 [Planctomycetes bacterium Poly30]